MTRALDDNRLKGSLTAEREDVVGQAAGFVKQDKRIRLYVVERNLFLRRKRMVRRKYKEEFLLKQLFELRVLGVNWQSDNRDIDFTLRAFLE